MTMKKFILSSTLFLFPGAVFAFAFPNLKSFVTDVLGVVDSIIVILTTIAFLAFFWGVAKFILAAGDSKTITEGKQYMLWGVIALFILVSMYAILGFFSDQFGFGAKVSPVQLPTGAPVESVTSSFSPIVP
jgi:hypothetical protein